MEDFEVIYPRLIKLPLFSLFPEGEAESKRILKLVYESLTRKSFHSGDVIIREGDDGDCLYILTKGKVAISRKTMAGDELALANLNSEQNVFFGEMSLITSEKRSATIRAESECETVVLSGKKFTELCQKEPLFGYRVLLVLCRRMIGNVHKSNSDVATLYTALFDEVVGDF